MSNIINKNRKHVMKIGGVLYYCGHGSAVFFHCSRWLTRSAFNDERGHSIKAGHA